MGLFGGNYSKEGPGVSKDALEKNRFFLFFELLGRKFTKLIPLNLMYVVTLIPLIIGILLSVRINPAIMDGTSVNTANIGFVPVFQFTGDVIGIAFLIASIFITGPATCGFVYVLRNMQRQEHTWIFSDFREQFKKNYKQGITIGIIDLAVAVLLYVAFCFYSYYMPVLYPESGIISLFGKYLIILFSIIFIMMHYYIHTMIVTFDMNLKSILKNALIFALGKLPLNIFISIIFVIILLASMWYFTIGLICVFIITLSFLGFIIVFSIYPTIEKSMMPHDDSDEDENAKDFEDTI